VLGRVRGLLSRFVRIRVGLALGVVVVCVVGVGSALASGGGVVGWSPLSIDSGLFESARLALASESGGEGAASGGGSVGVGLSDAAALSLAKREFADALVAPVWSAPLLGEGARITGFASDSTAVVVDGDKRTLLSSLLPLRSPDGDGAGIVSTGLDETSGGFEPANALTSITVGDEAGVAASFARAGVSVSPLGGAPGADGVRLGSDKVFYANIARDTDFVVAALPAGVETFAVLRSSESPAEQGLKVGLPAGATLERSPDGAGVSIVKDGRVMAQVSPASAVDANGNNVPVSESVVGDTVRISVDRSGDVAYPILVDPTITLSQTYWDTTGSTVSLAGWSWKTTNPNGFLSSTNGGWGRGLYSMVKAQLLASGDSGEWRYTAPGDSKVTLAQLHHVTRVPNTANGFKPICTSQGILNPLNGWEPGLTTTVKANDTSGPVLVSSPRTVCQNASSKETAYFSLPAGGGSAGNSVVNTQWAYGAGTRTALTGDPFGISEYDMIGGAYIQIQDDKQPTAEATTSADWPTGWTNHYEGDITVGANDTGTGIWKVNLAGDPSSTGTNSANQEQGIYCDGTQTIPCPASWNTTNQWAYTKTFHINTDNLPEGDNTLTLTTTDRTGNTSTPQQIHIKIDRTAPTVTFSGSLSEAQGEDLVTPYEYLTVYAEDPSPSGGVGSGADHVEILVDGRSTADPQSRLDANCVLAACSIGGTLSLRTDSLPPGTHLITVLANDRANQSSPANTFQESWTTSITFSPPADVDSLSSSAYELLEGWGLGANWTPVNDCVSNEGAFRITALSDLQCQQAKDTLGGQIPNDEHSCVTSDQTSTTTTLVCSLAAGGVFEAFATYEPRSQLAGRVIAIVVAAALDGARATYKACKAVGSWLFNCNKYAKQVIYLATYKVLGYSLARILTNLATSSWCSADNFGKYIWAKQSYPANLLPMPRALRTAVRLTCAAL